MDWAAWPIWAAPLSIELSAGTQPRAAWPACSCLFLECQDASEEDHCFVCAMMRAQAHGRDRQTSQTEVNSIASSATI